MNQKESKEMDKEVEGGKKGGGDNVNIVFMQEIPKTQTQKEMK